MLVRFDKAYPQLSDASGKLGRLNGCTSQSETIVLSVADKTGPANKRTVQLRGR